MPFLGPFFLPETILRIIYVIPIETSKLHSIYGIFYKWELLLLYSKLIGFAYPATQSCSCLPRLTQDFKRVSKVIELWQCDHFRVYLSLRWEKCTKALSHA